MYIHESTASLSYILVHSLYTPIIHIVGQVSIRIGSRSDSTHSSAQQSRCSLLSDPYQALPTHGYTAMFERLLDSRHIVVRTNVDYFDVKEQATV